MPRNTAEKETNCAYQALRTVSAMLPARWTVSDRIQSDSKVELIAPTGESASFTAVARRAGSTPTSNLHNTLREQGRKSSRPILYLSDYVGPGLRESLAQEGISFADSTGWVQIASEAPLILLKDVGAPRAPRPPRKSAVVRLNGVAASRIIRTIVFTELPVGVRELAELANVSPGSVSKLLATLTSEGIVDRDRTKRTSAVRPRALIRRWVQDYGFTRTNPDIGYYIAPRGISKTLARLEGSQKYLALTGSAAARRLLPEGVTSVVPLQLLSLHSETPQLTAEELGLIVADPAAANVIIGRPQDPEILQVADRELPIAPRPCVTTTRCPRDVASTRRVSRSTVSRASVRWTESTPSEEPDQLHEELFTWRDARNSSCLGNAQ